jgi:hypothetical protein
MRDPLPPTLDGLARSGFTCQACDHTVITTIQGLYDNPAVGSPQRFCSPACRQAAWRRRQAGTAENTPANTPAGGDATSPTNDHDHRGVNFHPSPGGQFSAVVDMEKVTTAARDDP